MSKLSSFSNKNKYRLCDVYIGRFVKIVWGIPIPGSCVTMKRAGCFFNEIIFFDKEEKIIETKYDIFIISSIADEQFFWMTLEENVNYYE